MTFSAIESCRPSLRRLNHIMSIPFTLLVLLLLLSVYSPSFGVESRRYGFPAKTLHVKEAEDEKTLTLDPTDGDVSGSDDGRGVDDDAFPLPPTSSAFTGPDNGADEDPAEADPGSHRHRRSAREQPHVTTAKLNTTQHKVVVHWAGEGSRVIVALATSILLSRSVYDV